MNQKIFLNLIKFNQNYKFWLLLLYCWIVIDILNLLSETKINYWFKHLLNCNISAILVAIINLINISKE